MHADTTHATLVLSIVKCYKTHCDGIKIDIAGKKAPLVPTCWQKKQHMLLRVSMHGGGMDVGGLAGAVPHGEFGS